MEKQTLLKQFEYSIPASALDLANTGSNHSVTDPFPLMKVIIDFENGSLNLEGHWQYLMASNKHNEPGWFTCHTGRVKIETAIFPAFPIELNDPENDGLVLVMEGIINDSESIGDCSGLLILDNVRKWDGLLSNQWDISFYIYDLIYDYCEIKFRLPVYNYSFDGFRN